MPVQKTVTLAEAKAIQTKATQEPTPEQLEAEEKKTLAILSKQDEEEDHDEKAAREMKERIAKEKAENKVPPSAKKRDRTHGAAKSKKHDKKCERCKKQIHVSDVRAKYCGDCAKIVSKEASQAGAGRPELDQDEVQEKLRPFLRIGLNLKEACLEAELSYTTTVEKKRTWPGFAEFIERHMNYSVIKAKRNVFANLGDTKSKENVATSKWLLEKRRPKEYGNRIELGGSIEHVDQLSEEKQAILYALIAARK